MMGRLRARTGRRVTQTGLLRVHHRPAVRIGSTQPGPSSDQWLEYRTRTSTGSAAVTSSTTAVGPRRTRRAGPSTSGSASTTRHSRQWSSCHTGSRNGSPRRTSVRLLPRGRVDRRVGKGDEPHGVVAQPSMVRVGVELGSVEDGVAAHVELALPARAPAEVRWRRTPSPSGVVWGRPRCVRPDRPRTEPRRSAAGGRRPPTTGRARRGDAVEPRRPLPPDDRRNGDGDEWCADSPRREHEDRRGDEHAESGGVGTERVRHDERRRRRPRRRARRRGARRVRRSPGRRPPPRRATRRGPRHGTESDHPAGTAPPRRRPGRPPSRRGRSGGPARRAAPTR